MLLAMFAAAAAAAQVAPEPSEAIRTARNLAKTHRFAQCLVRQFRPQVVGFLEAVPGSSAERARMAEIRRRGRPCAETVASLDQDTQYLADFSISPVTLRGPLAEALYENDFVGARRVPPRSLADIPAGDRIVGAPGARPEGTTPADVRRFAYCAVASAPDASAALLAVEPSSPTELEAVRRLVSEFDFCFPSDEPRDINIPTVRGFVAEAVYRQFASVARGSPLESPTDRQIARRGNADSGAVVIVPLPAQASQSSAASQDYGAEDVRTLVTFSRCAALRRPGEAEAVLALDYRQDAYDRAARELASRSAACRPDGRLRFSRILFAGGLAEERLSTLLNGADLRSRVAPAQTVEARDSTEAIGLCLVRSDPAGVAALLATAPASPDEYRAVRTLTPRVADCVTSGQIARLSQPSLRAIASIAAYRLVQQNAAQRPARN